MKSKDKNTSQSIEWKERQVNGSSNWLSNEPISLQTESSAHPSSIDSHFYHRSFRSSLVIFRYIRHLGLLRTSRNFLVIHRRIPVWSSQLIEDEDGLSHFHSRKMFLISRSNRSQDIVLYSVGIHMDCCTLGALPFISSSNDRFVVPRENNHLLSFSNALVSKLQTSSNCSQWIKRCHDRGRAEQSSLLRHR
jgi:hypothetical protein